MNCVQRSETDCLDVNVNETNNKIAKKEKPFSLEKQLELKKIWKTKL